MEIKCLGIQGLILKCLTTLSSVLVKSQYPQKTPFLKALSDNEDCKVMSRFFYSQLVSYVTSRAASTGSMHEGHVKPGRKVNILTILLGTKKEKDIFLTSHQPIVNAFCMISMHTGKISYAITNYEFNHANHTSKTKDKKVISLTNDVKKQKFLLSVLLAAII